MDDIPVNRYWTATVQLAGIDAPRSGRRTLLSWREHDWCVLQHCLRKVLLSRLHGRYTVLFR